MAVYGVEIDESQAYTAIAVLKALAEELQRMDLSESELSVVLHYGK